VAGVALRLRTFGRRSTLDAALAEGADPSDDPALALRAQQLTAPGTCRAIANTIRNLLDAAEEPRQWSGGRPQPPLQHDAVLAARDELTAIARHLCDHAEAISPQAAALAAQLVWDTASPIYAQTDCSVWEWAQAVLDRLAGGRLAA
jgi:hypothetical protein